MGFFSSMSPENHDYDLSQKHPFMTCIVKVDTRSRWTPWERTVARVLNKCHGIHSFRMDVNGMVEISGTVDPSSLLRMLGRAGRAAELCWMNFGQCSSNLFMPTSGGSAYSYDGRYLHAPSNCRPKPPSQRAILPSVSNQNYVYGHDKMCYEKYGFDHVHSYQHRQQQGCDYQSGYSHGSYQAQNRHGRYQPQIREDEDVVCCCIVM